MSEIINVLEKLGSDASLRFVEQSRLAKVLDEQEISIGEKEAIMAKNHELIARLAEAPEIICQSIMRPDREQDDPDEEQEEKTSNG